MAKIRYAARYRGITILIGQWDAAAGSLHTLLNATSGENLTGYAYRFSVDQEFQPQDESNTAHEFILMVPESRLPPVGVVDIVTTAGTIQLPYATSQKIELPGSLFKHLRLAADFLNYEELREAFGLCVRQAPLDPAGATQGIFGAVERFDANGIQGWAADLKTPKVPLKLHVLFGNRIVGVGYTGSSREDVAALAGIPLPVCGFRIAWHQLDLPPVSSQEQVKDGLLLRIAGTDLVLTQAHGRWPTIEDISRWTQAAQTGWESSTRQDQVEGYLDAVSEGRVYGWAWNPNTPEELRSIELWVDDTLAGITKADHARPDLTAHGIGAHAFVFELPPASRDGQTHTVSVVDAQTGIRLSPGTKHFTQDISINAWIDGVTGSVLSGWVSREYPPVAGLNLVVWDGGEQVATGVAHLPLENNSAGARFRVDLPARIFDGRLHEFTVRDEYGNLLANHVQVLPYVATPEDALQRYGGMPLRGGLFQSAARRYEALRQQFRVLAEDPSIDSATRIRLKQIGDAHEQVVQGFGQGGKRSAPVARLDFPTLDQPKVSVIIPVHNKFMVTYNCLASLIVSNNRASFEVIVVDDGSSDETTRLGEWIGGLTVLRNEAAQGFVRSCNRGAAAARGEYVVLLNNDTEVGPLWIDELLAVFESQKNVGMAGAKLVYPDGTLQEAGGIVWNTGDPWNYGRGANPYDPRFNYLRDVDYLSGACIMLPKPLWDKLGGFSETFAPAYFEDTDLAFRVRAQGLRTMYTPFCEIVHFEGVSNGVSTASGLKRYQEINRPKFKRLHAGACRHNGTVGVDVELNKDRNIQYRALVIDATTPTPDKDAGSYAAVQEMRLLQSFGCKLTFVPENVAYLGHYTEELQRMGVECAYAPFITSPHELIRNRGREFDIVYITRYSVAEKYIQAIREFAPGTRIVFNNADLHFLRELRLAITSRQPEAMHRALKTREDELAVMRAVDLTLSYNEVEHAVIMSHNLDSTRVAKCPWVVELPPQVAPYNERRDIAFLGGYGHHPNVEAVEWFAKEIMPLLRERLPGARFLIYGSNPPKSFEALECEDIVVKGWVDDVAEVYDTCRVFVAPLKTGAGLKGKVVGALAHGVPSVLSPVAAEGVGLRDGLEARIPFTPEEWAEAITALYESRAAWRRCSDAARRFAKREYSFERARALMADALALVDIYPNQTPR